MGLVMVSHESSNCFGDSSVFIINNTATSTGNFALDYYLENDTHLASENRQINAGQLLIIDLSQSAPFTNDPLTGYVIITADQPFTAEIQPLPTPTPTPTPTPVLHLLPRVLHFIVLLLNPNPQKIKH